MKNYSSCLNRIRYLRRQIFNIVGEVPSSEMVTTMTRMMCAQSVTIDKESLNRSISRKESIKSYTEGACYSPQTSVESDMIECLENMEE